MKISSLLWFVLGEAIAKPEDAMCALQGRDKQKLSGEVAVNHSVELDGLPKAPDDCYSHRPDICSGHDWYLMGNNFQYLKATSTFATVDGNPSDRASVMEMGLSSNCPYFILKNQGRHLNCEGDKAKFSNTLSDKSYFKLMERTDGDDGRDFGFKAKSGDRWLTRGHPDIPLDNELRCLTIQEAKDNIQQDEAEKQWFKASKK